MPTEENTSAEEVVTIAEAAQELKVSIPRLRRLLAKPEWKGTVRQIDRPTKTGIRSTTVVPVSAIPNLSTALDEREHEQTNVQLVPAVQKTLADKDAEIEFLRGALRFAQESLLREQIAHADTRRLLAPPPREEAKEEPKTEIMSEPETQTKIEPQVKTETELVDSVLVLQDGPIEISPKQDVQEEKKPDLPVKKSWFARLFGG